MLKELAYPFDAKFIISKKKKIRRLLLEQKTSRTPIKIAILGGSTTNDIILSMELFLLNYGIQPDFFESEYNQYYQEALFPSDELLSFKPDIVYIHTTNRNVAVYPSITDSNEQINRSLAAEISKFHSIWNSLKEKFNCTIIQNNFEMPMFRLLGNKDASDIHGATNFLSRLNQAFYEYAQQNENFYICDINYISADYGLKEWSDPHNWYLYKYAMNLYAIPSLSFNVANIIKSIMGKNKKGFVLDLDNTLWGGIVGDDGVDNLELGPEETVGQAYLEFQSYLKSHQQIGVILNVDSKNDYENAIAGLNHPDGVLKPNDMIVIKANWEPKDRNFVAIANELNLLPESLVFIDDNPAERHIVSEQLPDVSVPVIDEVQDYIQIIDRNGFFETTRISSDDLKRNNMYRDNAKRAALEAKYEDYSDYLLSLEMQAEIHPFERIFISRIAQLTNKSNQFNLTTKRYTQEEIEQTAKDSKYITQYGKLKDRFGDNGVVSVAIGRVENDECHIELWLMSCRVLKRDMEFAMMDEFVARCIDKGVRSVLGYYYPTAKNKMVKDFYALHGFRRISENDNGDSVWLLNTNNYKPKNKVIKIIR